MKDIAIQLAGSRRPADSGVNLLREYVQSRLLRALQDQGAFLSWAFMGGTALRFLYMVHRYSEDLDFTLERNNGPSFADTMRSAVRTLEHEGYQIRARVSDKAVVNKAMIGFVGLEHEAGLTPHVDQVLWVRVELDTLPPPGAGLGVTTFDRFGLLRLQHHDLPSLFAGKIAAVLAREYTKGRDYYDLLWYLLRPEHLEPNATLLLNALAQTAPDVADTAASSWRAALRVRMAETDWADVRRDVAPFLEQPSDVDLLTPETFEGLL